MVVEVLEYIFSERRNKGEGSVLGIFFFVFLYWENKNCFRIIIFG